MTRLVVVSRSPRRLELLEALGIRFERAAAREHVETGTGPCPNPCDFAGANALAKANDAAPRYPNSVLLAFDTIVWKDGYAYGKPKDAAEARSMLRALSGAWHEVHTGLAVLDTGADFREVVCEGTRVKFKELTERELSLYAASPEVRDKAGAYGIQGLASMLIERIEGDYFNVVGLPLYRLRQALLRAGVDLLELAISSRA